MTLVCFLSIAPPDVERHNMTSPSNISDNFDPYIQQQSHRLAFEYMMREEDIILHRNEFRAGKMNGKKIPVKYSREGVSVKLFSILQPDERISAMTQASFFRNAKNSAILKKIAVIIMSVAVPVLVALGAWLLTPSLLIFSIAVPVITIPLLLVFALYYRRVAIIHWSMKSRYADEVEKLSESYVASLHKCTLQVIDAEKIDAPRAMSYVQHNLFIYFLSTKNFDEPENNSDLQRVVKVIRGYLRSTWLRKDSEAQSKDLAAIHFQVKQRVNQF